MKPHIDRLRAAIPPLFDTLTGRILQPGPPVTYKFADIHIAVVPADLGLGTVAADGCRPLGDDGVLSTGQGCAPAGPHFASYYEGVYDKTSALQSADCQLASAANGCTVAQPLEAALKALWPPPPTNRAAPGSIAFADGTPGHGDEEYAGFLRNDASAGVSQLLLVILTNQDDCSVLDPAVFDTPDDGSHSAAARAQTLCAEHPERMAPIERYVTALRSMRLEDAYVGVVVVAGIPPDLIQHGPAEVEDDQNDKYIDTILSDPRMQWRGSSTLPGYEPSCSHGGDAAYPPRRLLSLARKMGFYQATLGSVCDDDLTSAIHDWFARNELQVDPLTNPGDECNAQLGKFPRDATGRVPCQMTWELPLSREAWRPATPIACSERPDILSVPADPGARVGKSGGAVCEVRQAPVDDPTSGSPTPEAGPGFYVDSSSGAVSGCIGSRLVTYTADARPPEWVVVRMRCLQDAQVYASGAPGAVPSIGDPCDSIQAASTSIIQPCQPLGGASLLAKTSYRDKGPLFCHPVKHVCVMACRTDSDCPDGWICDPGQTALSASAGQPMCVNPSCDAP